MAAKGARGEQQLVVATNHNRSDIAQIRLETGADPNTRDVLRLAAEQNNEKIVASLLKAGADPNLPQAGGFLALEAAVRKGNISIVKMLLDHGGEVNAKGYHGRTPIISAVEGRNSDVSARAKMTRSVGYLQQGLMSMGEITMRTRRWWWLCPLGGWT